MKTTYRVVVTREDERWLAVVPAVPGAYAAARSLLTLERHLCQLIALLLDRPPRVIDLVLEFRTGDDELDARLAAVRLERQRLAQAEQALAGPTGVLVRKLVNDHLVSRSDAARLLRITPQRVAQLVSRQRPPNRSCPADSCRPGS
jgi:predicted RNase H-like HicB family nuclease